MPRKKMIHLFSSESTGRVALCGRPNAEHFTISYPDASCARCRRKARIGVRRKDYEDMYRRWSDVCSRIQALHKTLAERDARIEELVREAPHG